MSVRIQLRRDTAANWTATNPTLTQGEPGYETDTGKIKYGDGTTAWNSLVYAPAAAIVDGTIVNADVNASAAIAGTKISPDFGSQNVVTTGTSTAASFIPTSSTAPTNGVYLPAANNVAVATNGQGRLFVDASGRVGIGAAPAQLLTIRGANFTGSSFNGQAIEDPNAERIRVGYKDGSLDTGLVPAQIVQVNASELAIASRDVSTSAIRFHTGTGVPERLRITSTGQLSHIGAGSSGSPAVSFSGSAASNSLVIDSNSRVGIGTSAPAYGLEVNNQNIAITNRPSTGTGNPVLYLRRNVESGDANTVSTHGTLAFQTDYGINGTFVTSSSILAGSPGDNNNTYFAFSTTNSGGTFGERMRLTSTGLGIGTTSPNTLMHLASSAAGTALQIENSSDVSELQQSGNSFFITNYTASGPIVFRAGSSTERCRLDSSGRFLIGTSTAISNADAPNARLQVHTPNYYGADLAQYSADAFGVALYLEKSRSSSVGSQAVVLNNDQLGSIRFAGSDGSAFKHAAFIEAFVDGTPGANDMPGRLVFSTTADGASSPTERMRINNTGQTGVFCSSANAFYVSSSGAASGADISIVGLHSAVSTYTGTASFTVRTNGNVQNTNNSYGAISDLKLKENIVDAASQWSDIKALQVRNYNFKQETGQQTHTQIGLVAQEVELVSPGLVSEFPDRDAEGNDLGTVTKSVNYSVLYMKAVKALQEAMERIEALEQRLNDAGIN